MKTKDNKKRLVVLSIIACLTGCANNLDTPIIDAQPIVTPTNSSQLYHVVEERSLRSDGVDQGKDAYKLIRQFAGSRSIESPDLYANNHPEHRHIYEGTDSVVGDHFVFAIHKNHDIDRDITAIKDRQRNEIKGYAGSDSILKAYKHEVSAYHWKFKLNDEITLSKNFGHFFQLKAVDNGPGAPILTISGRDKGGEWLEVIHRIHGNTNKLATVDLEPIKGKWLDVKVFVNYHNQGQLELDITEVVSQKNVLRLSLDNIDMLRGEGSNDFVRPKWGIYRSLKTKQMLRDDEEQVYFADFTVQKLIVSEEAKM